MKQFDVTLTYVRADKSYPTGTYTINKIVISEGEGRDGLETAAALDVWFADIVVLGWTFNFRDIQVFESLYDPDGKALIRAVQEWQNPQTISGRAYFTGKGNAQEVDRDGS